MAKGDKKKKVEKSASFSNASTDSSISVPQIVDAGLGQETELITAAVSSQHEVSEKELEKSPNEFHETPHLSSIIVQRYEGEKLNDRFHGEGVVYFQGGNVYKGMFSEGLMQGHGVYIWADGTKYEGDFTANVPSGHGTYTWTDGSSYKGEVLHGIRNGMGTFRFAHAPAAYRGHWHQGKKHGKGTIYYNKEETSWYDGDWVNNIREGWGTRCYVSGNVYEGEWRNSRRHGEGRMTWLDLGQQYSGTWESGVQHGQGTHTWFLKRVSGSQYPLRNQYRGQFVQGVRHGHGSFSYASGALYTGEWRNNKKHGLGKFIFKNGRVFEGEFVNDHMEEFPSFCIDGSKSPDLSGIRTHTPCPEDGVSPRKTSLRDTATLGPDMALDIDTLLEDIPECQRDAERKQVEFAVLRHIADLRSIYSFYSSLGHRQSPDNTFLLSRLQFWRLLKDCGIHLHGLTLAQVDRFVSGVLCTSEDVSPLEIHSPFSTMLLRRFLNCIVILAYHTYHREIHSESSNNNVLVACFTKLMTDNILPHAKHVKGPLFSTRVHGIVAVNYVDRCWEIYQTFCKPNPGPLRDFTMTCRQFVWMCKDLVLVDAHLTATKLLEIIYAENGATPKLPGNSHSVEVNFVDNASVRELSSHNLNLEMTFLEFIEALLGCAEVKGRMAGQTNQEGPVEPSPRAQVPNVSRKVSPVEDSRESPQFHIWHSSLMPAATAKSSNHNLSSDMSSFKSVEIGRSRTHLLMSSSEDMETRDRVRSIANLKSPTTMDSRSGDTVERREEESVAVAAASPVSMQEANLSHQTLCPSSTEPTEERGAEGKSVGPEASVEVELDLWIQRTHTFFTHTFFPAFEYSLLLRKEMEDQRLRDEATSRIALAKAKEKARLREQWEAEERERRREEEEEEEADKADLHEEEGALTPVASQTPVASTTSVVAAAKQPHAAAAAAKKKKK